MVLRQLLQPRYVTISRLRKISARSLFKLLLTNKETKALALDIHYGEDKFVLERYSQEKLQRDRRRGIIRLYKWAYPNPAVGTFVHNLEVVVRVLVHTGFQMARSSNQHTQ
jgi:hypothetical protein